MAFQSFWFTTKLPLNITECIEEDLSKFDEELAESVLIGGNIDNKKRKSTNSWIPTTHWVGGFLFHYILKANRENFLYDILGFENETLQYTQYGIDEYYHWHQDGGLSIARKPEGILSSDFLLNSTETCRKLSVSLQLNGPDDYEGGFLEFMSEDDEIYQAPKERGTVVVFDSRAKHRVTPVTNGIRKSLVGWVNGPRWR